jgi:hypothetical protein
MGSKMSDKCREPRLTVGALRQNKNSAFVASGSLLMMIFLLLVDVLAQS